ncbi:MAG: hypothetical protein HY393_01900 [Candidatus Diapherotrites archaeon]|nr:hypothetical protein [Candidatus Diapherotrites archaeon]
MPSNPLHYEKHQRDYTLLGTCVVFQAFLGKGMCSYYDYTPHPLFVLVKNRVLYHFSAVEDLRAWALNWIKKYKTAELLLEHKRVHDEIVRSYETLLEHPPKDAVKAIQEHHKHLEKLVKVITAAIEIPEFCGPALDPALKEACMHIRVENENIIKEGFSHHAKLLERIEREKNIPRGTLSCLTLNEFNAFSKTGKLPQNVLERKDFVLVRHTQGKEEVFLDERELKRFGLISQQDFSLVTELKGQTAFAGKAQGKVHIIKFIEEAQHLIEGEVLVTGMTDPRYVPAMKKASAIITNEGGITCHAAIVSRELGIPCVIGTKIATKVLKDGWIVQVKANHGQVIVLDKKGDGKT